MSTTKEIKAAVQSLGENDDTLWEPNGAPSLEALRILLGDENLTVEDIAKATNGFKRAKTMPEASKETTQATPGSGTGTADSPPDEEPLYIDPVTVDVEQIEPALLPRVYARAQALLTECKEALSGAYAEREEAGRKIDGFIREKDKIVLAIERLTPKISAAAGVRAIQIQTQRQLQAKKDASLAVAGAIAASGMRAFPSKLDEQLAHRKRTPEETANYAKFVHQNAAARTAPYQVK